MGSLCRRSPHQPDAQARALLGSRPSLARGASETAQALAMALLLLALAGVLPRQAWAHGMTVSAHVEGNTIQGKAYFRDGTAVREAQVTALDPDGRELGTTTTDRQGSFVLEVHQRCDHKIVVATADGHGDDCTVHAAELPVDGSSDQSLGDKVDALRRQVVALREQLDEYEDRVRFRDVLGGLGYLLGLAGVACYVLAKRRHV